MGANTKITRTLYACTRLWVYVLVCVSKVHIINVAKSELLSCKNVHLSSPTCLQRSDVWEERKPGKTKIREASKRRTLQGGSSFSIRRLCRESSLLRTRGCKVSLHLIRSYNGDCLRRSATAVRYCFSTCCSAKRAFRRGATSQDSLGTSRNILDTWWYLDQAIPNTVSQRDDRIGYLHRVVRNN